MKLTLTKKEKTELINNNSITVNRQSYLNTPKSSILHGKGIGQIFDKVDYRWVFGDTDDYIKIMKNIGRRATDYPDNKCNISNGRPWWKFEKLKIDEFGIIGSVFISGRKNKIAFSVKDIFISRLKKDGKYLRIIITAKLNKE